MAAKKGSWIGGTAVVSVAVMAAAWLLAVNPQMAEAAELREQTEAVDSQNAALAGQLDQLVSDFAHLDEYKAQLADLRTQIPTTDGLSDYLRELDGIATQHHVVITAVSPSAAQAFVLAAPAAPTTPPVEETTEDGTASEDGAPTEDPAATDDPTADDGSATPAPETGPTAPPGLAAIPVSITVVGTYDDTVAFIGSLQTGTQRLLLVSGITATGQKQAEAGGGRPATGLGDQEATITGYLYVLPDTSASAPDPSAEPTPAPELPSAPGRNPLVPVVGQ